MNSDTPKGGIATPESPPPITQIPQAERTPTLAPYPPYQQSYPSAPYRYPPMQPRKPGGCARRRLDYRRHRRLLGRS